MKIKNMLHLLKITVEKPVQNVKKKTNIKEKMVKKIKIKKITKRKKKKKKNVQIILNHVTN